MGVESTIHFLDQTNENEQNEWPSESDEPKYQFYVDWTKEEDSFKSKES